MYQCFRYGAHVEEAIQNSKPIVALESTLIAHGLPSPDNLKTANKLEQLVLENNSIPATTAIMNGEIVVGMNTEEIKLLSESKDVLKINLSNIFAAVASGKIGATTVASTIWAVSQTDIKVMATGGIGGVHRNFAQTGDVSPDLTALGECPIAVVSAGAKSILDLPMTVQRLETAGVPIIGYQTDEFPSFFRRESGCKVDIKVESIEELANICKIHWKCGRKTAVLIVNPVPEEDELPLEIWESAWEQTQRESENVTGRDLTPFLLSRLDELTKGETVKTNIALLENNVTLASKLAVLLNNI